MSYIKLPHYAHADRLMLAVLWLLFLAACGLANMYETWGPTLAVGLPAVVLPTLLYKFNPGGLLTRCVIGAATMVMAGLHIHQAMGMTEVHFGIFVLLAFLLCYRDWRPIIVATLVIAVHHVSFNFLQELNYGPICFTKTGWGITLLHAGYVVVETVVLVYLAYLLHKAAVQSVELENLVEHVTANENALNLLVQHIAPSSSIAKRLQLTITTLANALNTTKHNTNAVTQSATDIAVRSGSLFTHTEHQVAALATTTIVASELGHSVQANTEKTREAASLVVVANNIAHMGGSVVQSAVATMAAIEQSSHKIEDITSVIDGIAFQTNILALNAAVEAARAGEAGRGFAVVASEVRMLAQRSAAAAKEIKALIQTSVAEVAAGNDHVKLAGTTMQQIVDSVEAVAALINEIENDSRVQRADVDKIGITLNELNSLTLSNKTLVEQSAQALETMRMQARDLSKMLEQFEVE